MKPTLLYRLLPLLTCLLLALAGCGKKGPVKPLEKALPAAPQKLTAVQQGKRFQVAWDLPKVNQDGSVLTDLQGFRVYKMRYDAADDCPECRDTSTLLLLVDLDFLKNAERRGDRLNIWDNVLQTGFGYQYRVTPYTTKNREGEPAIVRRPFLPAIAGPRWQEVSGHDRMARLLWQTPELPAAAELVGYNLYRLAPGEKPTSVPVNSTPLTEARHEDFGLQNDVTYSYSLRVIVRLNQTLVESEASQSIEVTPRIGQ